MFTVNEVDGSGFLLGVVVVGAATSLAGVGLTFLFRWPMTRREAAVRIICSLAASIVLGPSFVFALHSFWPTLFESARNLAVQSGIQPWTGVLAIACPIMAAVALPAWWVIGALVRWLDRRQDKDIGELASDAAELVKRVRAR